MQAELLDPDVGFALALEAADSQTDPELAVGTEDVFPVPGDCSQALKIERADPWPVPRRVLAGTPAARRDVADAFIQ